jgi:hypothetical protein
MQTEPLIIKNINNIYKEVAINLYPFRNSKIASVLFIAEGTKDEKIIGLKYPGKKVSKREGNFYKKDGTLKKNAVPWANLYDFEVVPFKNNEEIPTVNFTFDKIFIDFKENKNKDNIFWEQIKKIYYNNELSESPTVLPGIDARLFLLMLKWIWIQEDFNYKLKWRDLELPETERYCLRTRTGSVTSQGAGRAKFFAALILLKYGFTYEEVKKIIPLY